MIDGLITFYHSGFDAQVYCLCIGGFTAIGINRLRKSADRRDFIYRLANELTLLAALAGIGLLIFALLRYFATCFGPASCPDGAVPMAYIGIGIALIVSITPIVAYRSNRILDERLKTLKIVKTILRLPAPETFAHKETSK